LLTCTAVSAAAVQVYGLPFNLTRKYQAAVGKPLRTWVSAKITTPLNIKILAPVVNACKGCFMKAPRSKTGAETLGGSVSGADGELSVKSAGVPSYEGEGKSGMISGDADGTSDKDTSPDAKGLQDV
jgi:hypothetical protein